MTVQLEPAPDVDGEDEDTPVPAECRQHQVWPGVPPFVDVVRPHRVYVQSPAQGRDQARAGEVAPHFPVPVPGTCAHLYSVAQLATHYPFSHYILHACRSPPFRTSFLFPDCSLSSRPYPPTVASYITVGVNGLQEFSQWHSVRLCYDMKPLLVVSLELVLPVSILPWIHFRC